ncbi:hypothetical protein ABW19_dt0203997 [Dactylella cylindrospora]|nr:hypothetical protein ABW19_dt0203997 [Dactylella cylindrospora]
MGRLEETPPLFWKFRSSSGFIVFSVCFAIFVDVLLYGCIVQGWLAVLLAVYGLGFSIGSPAFGWLADHYKNRWWPLMAGLFLLLSGTLMLWIGTVVYFLCFARFVQGLATACIWSVGLALVIDTVGSGHAGESMGLVAATMSVGFVGAPSLSGILYDNLGYDSVFICMVVMVIFDIFLRILIIEKKDAAKWIALEIEGVDDPRQPLLSPATKTPEPNFDLEPHVQPILILIQSPRLVTAVFMAGVMAIIMTSFETVLPLHTKERFGYTSTLAGLCFAVVVFGDFFSTYIGRLSDRIGAKPCAVAGCLLGAVSIFLLRFPDSNSIGSQVALWVLLAFVGFSHCLIFVPMLTELSLVVEQIEREKPGVFGPYGAFAQSYGLSNFAYAVGTTVGPLWSGFMRASVGWNWMTLALAIMSLLSTIPVMKYSGEKKPKKQDDEEGVTNGQA